MLAFLYRKVLCIVSTHLEVTFKSVGEPDNSVPHHTQRFLSTHSMTVLHPSVDVFCCCANSMFYRTCGHFRWCNFHIEVQPISCGHKLIKKRVIFKFQCGFIQLLCEAIVIAIVNVIIGPLSRIRYNYHYYYVCLGSDTISPHCHGLSTVPSALITTIPQY